MTFPTRVALEATKIQDCVQICPARIGQIAVTWALRELAPWQAEKRRLFIDKATEFRGSMRQVAGWEIVSIGAYFAYLRHPFDRLTDRDVARRLARENGLLLIPGSYFGAGQERYLRLSFGNLTAETLAGLPDRLALIND